MFWPNRFTHASTKGEHQSGMTDYLTEVHGRDTNQSVYQEALNLDCLQLFNED